MILFPQRAKPMDIASKHKRQKTREQANEIRIQVQRRKKMTTLEGSTEVGISNGLLEDFCMENDFIVSDYEILPQDTFTYISDAHNTTSWIDQFISSFSVHQAMLNMDVLPKCIISDHRAVAVSIQCSHLPEFDDEVMEPQPSRIDWLIVMAQEREDYYHKSKNLLDQLQVPTEVRYCQNFNCTDEKHLEE